MPPVRRAPLTRLALTCAFALSALSSVALPSAHAAMRPAVSQRGRPAGARPSVGHDAPPAGPRLLQVVSPNAFPIHQGYGDFRFGVAEAAQAPGHADDLHVGWEREQIRWDLLQPDGPDQWNVNATGFDQLYDRQIAHGHQLVGVIQGVPAWAAQNPRDGNTAVPKNIGLPWNDTRNYWGQFVYRAARHYAGRIDTLIILNEVNIATGPYHQFSGTPEQYAQMLRVAYLAAHAANPHVEVHIYGDSVYADYGAWFRRTVNDLAALPNARANNYFFDAADVHLYTSIMRWDRLMAIWHAAMTAHGFDKPIWLTETGLAPRNDKVIKALPAEHNSPLAYQPSFLVDSFSAALGLGMPRVEVYRMLDPKTFYPEHPMGLVRRDGSLRDIYYTFQTLDYWLAGVTATAYFPGTEPYGDKNPLFRVVMERPGQEIQVVWNQGGKRLNAVVPAVARTATIITPLGKMTTVHATHGFFVLPLDGATDRSLSDQRYFKTGGTPLIVAQNLPRGGHVPGLHRLFVELDRTAGAGDTLGPTAGVATAPDGSARAIADPTHDRVLVEDAAGRITARIGHTGGKPGQFRGPAGVAIGPDDTLYVADQGNARIQEFDLAGRLLGGFGSYDAGAAALKAPVSVAAAADGTLYIVDAAQDAVLHFTRQGGFLGRWGSAGDGAGQFDGPGGIAVDLVGNVYVADTLNNRVVELDGQGHTLAQIGTGAPAGDVASLHWPTGVDVRPDGRVVIADADNARLMSVAHPRSYIGTTFIAAVVRTPGGFAIAPDGTYYVSDTAANKIVHLDANGNVIARFGIAGTSVGHISAPLGVALGPDGNLYVCDTANGRIQVFTTGGTFVRKIGQYGSAPGQFIGPRAISVASDGTLWVADTVNTRVQHLSATGDVIAIVGHINGVWGVASDGQGGAYYSARYGQRIYHVTRDGQQQVWGGPGTAVGQFSHPGAVAASPDGSAVYVADEDNKRIQFVSGGVVAGQRGGDSSGPAGLGDPTDVAVARDGSIVVLDAARHRLVAYQGAMGAASTITAVPGVPLGLSVGTHGTTVMVVDPSSGAGAQQTGANS